MATNNMVICLGGCGSNIANELVNSETFANGLTVYAVDSITDNVNINNISKINHICVMADDRTGSGRNRERGKALYKFHEDNGTFDKMYQDCENAKAPILVVTSAAGGTGSGSVIPVCEALIMRGIDVIPIIICPNMDDPESYHLNTNDLFLDLAETGIETYAIFQNSKGDADYGPVNTEVVNLIEIILGKRYTKTNLDSIDDSDLDTILSVPGRFIATSASAPNIQSLRKEITRKVFSGFQPAWNPEDVHKHTIVTAYSLTSMFAETEFKEVFDDIRSRLDNVYDEFRNIANNDNSVCEATIIVAGLPRSEVKVIDSEYKEAGSIAEGMKRSKRPSFMNRKKASVTTDKTDNDGDAIKKFSWK